MLTERAGEYRFSARKCGDGLWRFSHWELQMHFMRPTTVKNGKGRPLGATSAVPEATAAALRGSGKARL